MLVPVVFAALMIGVVGLSVLTTESVGEVNDIWNPLVPPKADVVPAVVIIATHVMRYIPAPAAGTEYSVVAVIAADCAVRSTVASSEGTPADTVATPAYLMTLLNDRLPVVSEAVPLPIAKDAAPRREMFVSVLNCRLVGNVQFVRIPEAGVPKAGVVNVGEVSVLLVSVCDELVRTTLPVLFGKVNV